MQKLGKGQRNVPSTSQRAKKFYAAEPEAKPRKARKSIHNARVRQSLQPGTVLILLAGRFRGKRVVLLKHLAQGVILVTGPFKINGVPLRRVNARYVIATGAKVDVKSLDNDLLNKIGSDGYFAKSPSTKGDSEEDFFKQGEKRKEQIKSTRVNDQKMIDKELLSSISKVPHLKEYLASTFSLRKGDKPHEMTW